MLQKYFDNKDVSEVGYNFNDVMVKDLNMCNYIDTIPGILAIALILQILAVEKDEESDLYRALAMPKLLVHIVDFTTYISDIIDLVQIF